MEERALWIWPDVPVVPDQHCNFYTAFSYTEGPAELLISADSNYAVWVNGQLADSGQYPDFPHYKVFDRLDLSRLCVPGENHLAITVWYYGKQNMSYFPGQAALRFQLNLNGVPAVCSGKETLSRLDPCYENGRQKKITSQLGFGFHYDLNRDDGWKTGTLHGFTKSLVLDQDLPMFPRPVEKCAILPPIQATVIGGNGSTHFLIDLGREETGFLTFRLRSSRTQKILVAYGEHIEDGSVRRIIGKRDFSVEITLREGENTFTDPFRRFGCRYLEVFAEEPLALEEMTLLPVEYPVNAAAFSPTDPLRKQIYDTALRTLHICMHDHYEDTPWREQGLYSMDSRNQMLCGYYGFSEFRFPRANLLLMSKDRRADGLLNICVPSGLDLTIPSFSLHYFTQVWEYVQYSEDLTLIREIYPKLETILDVFLARLEDGLVPTWEGKNYWNFYEWAPGLDGSLGESEESHFDAPLNCLFSLALQRMQDISNALGLEKDYLSLSGSVNEQIRLRFFDSEEGAFRNGDTDWNFSQLTNALAVLCGAASDSQAREIARRLADYGCSWTPATLSMLCFVYDALLMADKEGYRAHILRDIDTRYKRMLDGGATSFWETEKGPGAFDRAGSLSHGWSAMPVYYYNILL